MAYLDWNDSLSVNVPVIDEQHQELVRLINQLHEAMTQGQGHRVLGETVEGLIEYAQIHFRTEERYFDASDYPDSVAHKKKHEDFVVKVTDFKQGFDEGRLMMSLDVMDFLVDWLVKHIKGTDKTYVPFLS
jgi:hemerythrin